MSASYSFSVVVVYTLTIEMRLLYYAVNVLLVLHQLVVYKPISMHFYQWWLYMSVSAPILTT